jgi:uncharacterized protein (DUF1501 family)
MNSLDHIDHTLPSLQDQSLDHEIAPGITRRSFMAALGLTAGAVAIPGWTTNAAEAAAAPSRQAGATTAQPSAQPSAQASAQGDGIVVMVTLYGGNDGLNTVVPFADPAYLASRQGLAVPLDQVLKLDNSFGLHPSLKGLKSVFDVGRLAVVQGVGYPEPNRSHFRSMDIWQTGRPAEYTNIGWLGRWHDATGPDALRMVNVGNNLPRYMNGTKGSGAAINPGRLTLPGGKVGAQAIANLGRNGDASLGALGARIAASNADLVRVRDAYAPVLGGPESPGSPGASNLEGEGNITLTRDLQEVAKLINAGAPGRVYGVSLGGFDTHASELGTHARLLGYVDQAVTGFVNAMAASPRGGKVTVVVYSEFGRRVVVNGSDGTDHGTAAPMFVVGPQVKGGLYGQPSSLTDLDQGDLKFTTDFRSVYATVMGKTLGIDPAVALGSAFPLLPFL